MIELTDSNIVKFLKDNVEPLEDSLYGPGYRAAVYLTDGTFLPSVVFRNPKAIVDLAKRRFKEELSGKGIFGLSSASGYYNIVKNFTKNGNRLNSHDIESIEKSRFAFPVVIQKQIQGETTMGWTGFVAKMNDGKIFSFGTTFRSEFFNLPDNYNVNDITEIINHSFVSKSGDLRSHREGSQTFPNDYNRGSIYRERMFFECFIDGL